MEEKHPKYHIDFDVTVDELKREDGTNRRFAFEVEFKETLLERQGPDEILIVVWVTVDGERIPQSTGPIPLKLGDSLGITAPIRVQEVPGT